ncbi:DUF4446 family protein, partial [Patescibacteria group bacterium]|nr:DUF4446 family protein [Patescibacteria group bacterium]
MQLFLEDVAAHPLTTILGVFSLILLAAVLWLAYRIDVLTKGGDGKSLESTIAALGERIKKLERHAGATTEGLKNHEDRIQRAVSGVAVKRFDPFQNAGGQQSFASALLNEKGDGVVLSGIHSRDGVRVYAKEVKGFASERELSEEETGAIAETKTKLG